ncbi:DUF4357 domain-containing protein [Lysinibacillus sp. NPDC098008]|uniref:DUF4357 domain-containing protein n=1 Tax=Lysinibacillus sp. NPDC098008 TaxID=3364146 RepID=UPI00382E872B
MRLTVKPADEPLKEPNVFLNNGKIKGYYDKDAIRYKRIMILPDSILSSNQKEDLWMIKNIKELVKLGCIEEADGSYIVKKPLYGTPSGTVAFSLGLDGPPYPNGYIEWKFEDGKNLKE